ncbi:SDR family oxidoreductase [Streptomyces javensis]|uniref:SDR family NAD(P)-dependent oxidoreductase n=1 Tax=Streptomyces javensis TaxID=114698 RepID=A0ABS0RC17_9ACTN|nr:SDR family NAD(P)-dependent oxidoreductase [Streptomyces javensis]MBI0314648.1 SDR family NAD(P)-dependent oxidoreductase [Streptomyces javensis]
MNTGNDRHAGETGPSYGPLSGCVALVTGASSGIGAATAVALARQGADLAVVARRTERLEDLAATARKEGRSCAVLTADLRDTAQARRCVEDAVEQCGRLDVLVNNAGSVAPGKVEEGDPEGWERMLDLNVRTVLHTSQQALPHLLRTASDGPRGVADVVNVSSVAGRLARPGNGVYSATKHAVGAMSEAMRQEVTARGVRVGLIEPGMVATELTTDSAIAAAGRGMPRESWLHPEDIARALVFLCSAANGAITGETLTLAGRR